MPSLSESSEHRKIRDTKELVQQSARWEVNSDNTTWRVWNLIGACNGKNQLIDATWLHARILTNTLTRAEKRKVREMAGVSKLSRSERRIKATLNHALKYLPPDPNDSALRIMNWVWHPIGNMDIEPADLILHAPGWDSHDDENFQDALARANEEEQH